MRGCHEFDKAQTIFAVTATLLAVSVCPVRAQLSPEFGQCANFRSDPDGAIAACNVIIQAGRTNPHNLMLSFFNRGLAWGIKGVPDRAIPDFDQSIRIEPDHAPSYSNRGIAYSKRGDFELAIRDFDKAIGLNPNNPQVYLNRGSAYGRRCNTDQALADFEQAIVLDPNLAAAYSGRGASLLEKGDAERAIVDATRAIELNAGFAPAYSTRASAYTRKRDFARAMADIEQAISLDPKLPSAYNSRGTVHSAKGELDLAISDFGQAILLDPKFGAPYSRRGFAFRQKGEIDRAIVDYDRAIQLIPTCSGPYYNRADAYALKGELQRALSDANLAIRLSPRSASAYATRGSIYLKMDNVPTAIRDLSDAIRLDPTLPEPFTNRGLAYERQNDHENARADFQAALNLPLTYLTMQWVHDTAKQHLAATADTKPSVNPKVILPQTATAGTAPRNYNDARAEKPAVVPAGSPSTSAPPSAEDLRQMLAACDRESGDVGKLSLPGRNKEIVLDKCYRGPDHLACTVTALVKEASSIQQSYAEIAAPDYSSLNDIDPICRIDAVTLAGHLERAKGFDSRWRVLNLEYGKTADCTNVVKDAMRDVVLPELPSGGNIVTSMAKKIKDTIDVAAARQKEVSDLAVKIKASKAALESFVTIRRSSCQTQLIRTPK
jgi:tetratricopeptide (TPR) repeat protein